MEARCTVKLDGKTGVEMEALTGVTVALLTIYDMCKAIDKSMELTGIHLLHRRAASRGYTTMTKPAVVAVSGVKEKLRQNLAYRRHAPLSERRRGAHGGHQARRPQLRRRYPRHRHRPPSLRRGCGTAVFDGKVSVGPARSGQRGGFDSPFPDADLILLEGFKHSAWPAGAGAQGNSGRSVCEARTLLALVTDLDILPDDVPRIPSETPGSRAGDFGLYAEEGAVMTDGRAGASTTCASPSPTAATSAASTVCPPRGWRVPHASILSYEEIVRLTRLFSPPWGSAVFVSPGASPVRRGAGRPDPGAEGPYPALRFAMVTTRQTSVEGAAPRPHVRRPGRGEHQPGHPGPRPVRRHCPAQRSLLRSPG